MQSLDSGDRYRRLAREAEKQQERAQSPFVKASWERIVVGYLELADMADRRDLYERLGLTVDRTGASRRYPAPPRKVRRVRSEPRTVRQKEPLFINSLYLTWAQQSREGR